MTQRQKDYRAGHKHKVGDKWMVSEHDADAGAWREHGPFDYWYAVGMVRGLRAAARKAVAS